MKKRARHNLAAINTVLQAAFGKARKRKPKYGNVEVTTRGGVKHASGKQARRWLELEQAQKCGEIRKLRREVPYRLEVNGRLVCKYIADHVYERAQHDFCGVNVTVWDEVVEDVKSPITKKNRAYRIKLKLMRAIHGIEIKEV